MSVKSIEAEVSIKSGISADVTIGREVIRTIYEEPVLESLSVVENGVYEPSEGLDGYSDVTVSVPGKIPVLEQLNAIVNGEYYPAEGVDGFNEVLVNVPRAPEKMVASGSFTIISGSTSYVLDTKNTDWTHLVIVPHVFPYDGSFPRAITVKHVDLTNNIMISAYASSSGNTYTAASSREIYDGGTCEVHDGVVSFSGEQANVGRWIGGCQYDWYAWSEDALEPEETNIFEGEFEATEDGVLTIDTGYTGDKYPKAIIITPADGLMTAEFLSEAQKSSNYCFVINYYAGFKANENSPVYDSEEIDSAIRNYLVYMNSANKYTASYNSRYPFKTDEPTAGVNVLRIPDNRHIKIWCAKNRMGGTATYFWTNVKYRYQIFY